MLIPKNLTNINKPKINVLASNNYTDEYLVKVYDEALAHVKCIMAVVNQASATAMFMAYSLIKETPLYRGQFKRLINHAMSEYRLYEHRLQHGTYNGRRFFQAETLSKEDIASGKKQVSDNDLYEWWLDIGSCAYKRSSKEVEMLRWQLLQGLTYAHYDNNRNEVSHVVLANTLLQYSSDMFDVLMRDLTKTYHLRFNREFSAFSLRRVFEAWRRASVSLCTLPEDIELPKSISDNMNLAFRIFESAIMRDLNTATSANEAIRQNANLLDDDVYEEYVHNYEEALSEYQDRH